MQNTLVYRRSSCGFSLVELMVAMAVGLFLLGGVISLLISNKTIYTQVEQRGRLAENLRFAMDKLAHDLRMTNYRGCRNEGQLDGGNGIEVVPGDNDNDSDRLLIRFRVPPMSTYTNLAGNTLQLPDGHGLNDGDGIFLQSCGSDDWQQVTVSSITANTPASGTDTVTLTADVTGLPDSGWINPVGYVEDDNDDGLVENLYYLEGGELRMLLDAADTTPSGGQALVGGNGDLVENMQIMLGVDNDGDQRVNSYVHPGSVSDWGQVMSVKIALLLATEVHGQNQLDTNTYNLLGVTVDPPDERRQRKVVETTVQLRNMQSGL